MGIRSDVAVALKHNVYDNLSKESKEFLADWFGDEESKDEEGILYHTDSVKWYHDIYDDIRAFYTDLFDNHDDEDYLILQACYDYPESDEGNRGEWYNNPWGIYKDVIVSIKW